MNFDEAIANTTTELGDLEGQWYQSKNKPLWFIKLTDPNKISCYIEIEITYRHGIVGCVMDYDGMGVSRKTKIMDTFMKHLKPPADGKRPQYTIDFDTEISY